jgi:hypothetical protein
MATGDARYSRFYYSWRAGEAKKGTETERAILHWTKKTKGKNSKLQE